MCCFVFPVAYFPFLLHLFNNYTSVKSLVKCHFLRKIYLTPQSTPTFLPPVQMGQEYGFNTPKALCNFSLIALSQFEFT